MAMYLYDYDNDTCERISAREADRDYRESDAGTAPMNEVEFIVQADSVKAALCGAREWVRTAADDDDEMMPDGLYLEERMPPTGRMRDGYITLRVL